ncbi:hypothetical protein [Desulfonema ishimotonii]|nr:hypothetical protein [Desulfonema ishimotonii]
MTRKWRLNIRRTAHNIRRLSRLGGRSEERADGPSVPDLQEGLPELGKTLTAIMGDAEARFLALGRALQRLYEDADDLARLTRKTTLAIGGSEDDGLLNTVDRLVRDAQGELGRYRDDIAASLENVTRSSDDLGQLGTICPVVEKTGISLNVIGLNIAVESSRSADSSEMFSVLTGEIRRLSEKISRVSGNILEESSTTRSSQIEAHKKIADGLAVFTRLNDEAEEVVRESVRAIREIMTLSVSALERSERHSREIARQVGEVVVAIQFHDIVRQKIDHIASAFRDVAGLLTLNPDSPDAPQPGQIFRILKLQSAHLREVVGEIRSAHGKSTRAFDAVMGHVKALAGDISVFEAGAGSRMQARMGALKSGLEQLGELLSRGHELEAHIRATSGQVAGTVAQLSRHIDQVRDISLELHLKALNAIVKSARLQEKGRTLEILAQEVSKLSGESGGFVSDVLAILESLTSVSAEPDRLSDHGAENITAIEDGIQAILSHYTALQEDSATALTRSQTLQTDILETGAELGFLTELGEELAQYVGRIEAMAGTPDADDREEDVPEVFRQVAFRYTMDSERQLHEQHVGSGEPDVAEAEGRPDRSEPSEISGPAGDDLGNNVELF